MEKMSFKIRNNIAPEETPELIGISLLQVAIEMDRIKNNYVAYMEAMRGGHSPYVHDMDIRLRFLRCEQFDVPRAAMRTMKYLDTNLVLFGKVGVLEKPLEEVPSK